MIALITPTGCRPQQLELCAKFMKAQNYTGEVLWVLVDDARPITANIIPNDFRKDWTIVKVFPRPEWRSGQNTQVRNLQAGISIVKQFSNIEAVFIIEDDDYYSPVYLKNMVIALKGYRMVGEKNTIYYNVKRKGWKRNGNVRHSSLFQTAFTKDVLPVLEKICRNTKKFIDIELWKEVPFSYLFSADNLAVGIKGLPGRPGIGAGHKDTCVLNADPDFSMLQKLLGADYKYYIQ